MKILIKIDGYILKIASIFILLSVCLLIGLEDIDIGHKKIFWIIAMVVIIIALSFHAVVTKLQKVQNKYKNSD